MQAPVKVVLLELRVCAQISHPQSAAMVRGLWTMLLHVRSVYRGTDAHAQTLMPRFRASLAPTRLARNTDAHLARLDILVLQALILVRRAKSARIL